MAAVGVAKAAGSVVGQVGIQLALEKAFFNKDVKNTTKATESAFAKSFGRVERNSGKVFGSIGGIIKTAFAVVGTGAVVSFAKTAVNAASETQSAWTGLNSILQGTGKSFAEGKEFIDEYISDGLIPLGNAVTAYKNLAARGYSTEQIEKTMLSLKDAAAFGRQSSYSYGEAIQSATEGLKNENSVLVDNAGVTKNVAKMWEDYAKSIGKSANELTQAEKIQAEVNGIVEETKFQMGDAQAYADTYAGKIAKVNTAFSNFKVAVGKFVAPIVELFLPYVEQAINALTRLFNKLSQILKVFGLEMPDVVSKASSGISDIGASAGQTSDNLADTGNEAVKAAKKIKKAFANVDEINVLNTSKDSSSGSGSGGSSGGSGSGSIIGDTTTGAFDSTKEDITQNLEWLERSAYDWGVAFGNAINKGLELIPWDVIQTTTVGAVTKVAEFLNGAVESFNWNLLGESFGEGFNTIFHGLNAFLSTFDWENLGRGIISSINGTIKALDFDIVGESLKNGFNGAIDFMWGAVDEFDAQKAGEQIASFINNIAEAIWNIDWGKLGSSLSEGLSKAMETVRTAVKETDWAELTVGIVEGIVNFVSNIDWFGLGIDWLSTSWEIGWALVEGILAGIGRAVVGIGEILYNILIKPIIDKVKELFGINSPSTVFAEIGGYLIEGLWAGIEGMKDWFIGMWSTVQGWFSDIVINIKTVFNDTKEKIKSKWNDLTSGVKDKVGEMKASVKQKWSDIKTGWNNLTSNVKNKVVEMKASVKQKWSDLKTGWSNLTSNIKDKTVSMKAKVASKWTDLKSKWSSLMSNFKDKTISVTAKVGEAQGSVKGFANDVIGKINSKLPSWLPKIPKLAQGGWLKANSPQLAIVGDNKHEPEIVTPESKIREQVIRGIEEAGTVAQNQHFDFTIKLEYPDGKYLIKEINDTQIKDGKISLLV